MNGAAASGPGGSFGKERESIWACELIGRIPL